MGTYPCSNCGATADTATGCPSCGNTLGDEIAELNRTIVSMQQRNKGMVDERTALMMRLQGAIAIRSLLERAAGVQRGTVPQTSKFGRITGRGRPMDVPTRRQTPNPRKGRAQGVDSPPPTATPRPPGTTPPPRRPAGATPPRPGAAPPPRPRGATRDVRDQPSAGRPPGGGPRLWPRVSTLYETTARKDVPGQRAGAGAPGHPHHPPEITNRSVQNLVLGLGVTVMAIVVGLTPFLYGSLAGGFRILVLTGVAVAVALLPIWFAGRGLVTTAEWITPIGVLLVLLDGRELWVSGVRASGLRPTLYAALVCLAAAVVVTGVQRLSRLAVPRFSAIVLLQPVLPLALYPYLRDVTGWAAVLTATAAVDLIIARRTHHMPVHGRYLRAAVRWLQSAVTAAALACGGVGLVRAHHVAASVRAGAPVIAAAVVGLAGGLLLGRWPLPDIWAGLATVAAVAGFGRMAALALPGWGLLATAVAVAAVCLGARLLPAFARRGAQFAGCAAAIVIAVVVVVRGAGALAEPVRASLPPWRATLSAYGASVTAHTAPGVGQLVVSALLLTFGVAVLVPRAFRRDTLVVGAVLATLLVPGSWHLPWLAAIMVTAAVALALGVLALTATNDRESWLGIGAALLVGLYAAALAAASPASQAVLLLVFAIGGAAIGTAAAGAVGPPPPEALSARPAGAASPDRMWATVVVRGWHWMGGAPQGSLDARAGDAGWGAAALALPGATAAMTAGLATGGRVSTVAVLATSFVTVAGTLTAAAVSQVARRRPSPLLVGGAALGAVAVSVAALRTRGAATGDITVAVLLLASALLLVAAPLVGGPRIRGSWRAARRPFGLDGDELAAAAVTAASIAALARVASLLVPGYGLVTLAFLVTVVAAGTRSMPESWRRGPIAGGGLVGVGVAIGAGYAAVDAAIGVIRINHPVWHVPLAGWAHQLATHTTATAHSAQPPIALVLIATAAAIVLQREYRLTGIVIALGLAALAAPAALGTGWWGPALFSGVGATGAGLVAARMLDRDKSLACAGVATVLFADTIAASLVAPATTTATLLASAAVLGAVALTAATTLRLLPGGPQSAPHLILFGGACLALAVLGTGVAAGCLAATLHRPASTVLTATMAGLGIALVVTGLGAWRMGPLLGHASAAVSLGGLAVALADIRTLSIAGVYASVAALLAVLAELLRSAVVEGEPAAGWLPRRTAVLVAAGPATGLAVAGVVPTLLAALVGPYHQLSSVWAGAPASSLAGLGPSASLVGAPVGLIASILITITAAIGAVGYFGTTEAIVRRAVAVVTPGIAVTLLIAPYLLRAAWPLGPVAALGVATISGLALALTGQPPDEPGAPLARTARRIVVVICLLSAGAGVAGSLATPGLTIGALLVAACAGPVAALGGRTQLARVAGWIVTSAGCQLAALVICLRLHVAVYDATFVVGAVAAGLLILASTLPALRGPERVNETLTIEVSAYGGAVLALALATRSIPHLAVFLAGWGAVLGLVAARQRRSRLYRRLLIWFAAGHELAAWWLLMSYARVHVPEAYTLAIAVIALVTGWVEQRAHPELTSWIAYGVALTAALGPSLAITIATGETPLRRVLLLIGAASVTVAGAVRRQAAPAAIGGIALLGATSNELARYSTTVLILALMAIIAGVLIGVGANFEKGRRNPRAVLSSWLNRKSESEGGDPAG